MLPFMKAKGWGRIVTLTSTTVNEGVPNHCDYVATKAALVGASRVLAKELGQYGITVNCQALGLTRTAQSTYHVEKMIELGLPDYFQMDMEQSSIRRRSEEHTSELQSLMRISYAVSCLKKKKK